MFSQVRTGAGLWRRLRGDDGLGLPEVMVALLVLAVSVLGTASAVVSGLTSLRASRDTQAASQTASAAIERVRALDYEDAALNDAELCGAEPCWRADPLTTEVPAGSGNFVFDPDGPGPMAAEAIVSKPGGRVDPFREVDGNLTVRRYVTAYDDPAISPSTVDGHRVTAVVTWTSSGGNEREVRMSTIVAEAHRGLPLPRFSVTPAGPVAGVPQPFTPGSGNPPGSVPRSPSASEVACFEHTLVNVGARDSYEWGFDLDGDGQLDEVFDAFLTAPEDPSTLYGVYQNVGGDGWWAYGSLADVGDTVPMVDSDGDGHPASQVVVERNSSARLRVCYLNVDVDGDGTGAVDPAGSYAYDVVIRSSFDPDVNQVVLHEFGATVATQTLYPFFAETDRSKSNFRMGPVSEFATGMRPPDDGNATTTADGLIDYDPATGNEPGRGFAGLGLGANSAGQVASWDWQVGGTQTLGSNVQQAQLDFWSRFGSSTPAESKGKTDFQVRYEFRLQRIDTAKGVKVLNDYVTTRAYTHTQNGQSLPKWEPVQFLLNFPATAFNDGQFLRLEARCLNVIDLSTGLPVTAAENICNVAFGVDSGTTVGAPDGGTYEAALRFRR